MTTSWQQGDGGPGRKYFELTPAGREEFRVKATLWREFAGATVRFIGEKER
ncbi:PadR family transcriptional regulator [Mobilicoccus caccae]|uniref:PadR family transcriptional regulator n=1 Tax=Mobilicoccus caccae TaxID=1859295 RepID=UPI0032AFC00A